MDPEVPDSDKKITFITEAAERLAKQLPLPHPPGMADLTREEVDAKIGAAEARGDTKLARMDGKLDLVLSKLDDVRGDYQTVRTDIVENRRATVANIWVAFFGLVAVVVAIVATFPAIYTLGTQTRDIIREELKAIMPAPQAPALPPPKPAE